MACDDKYHANTSMLTAVAKSLVRENKPWLVPYYDRLLRAAGRRHAEDLMELYNLMIDSGHTPSLTTHRQLLGMTLIRTDKDLALLQTIYAGIRSTNTRITPALLKHVNRELLGPQWEKLACLKGVPSLQERLELALEIFQHEAQHGNFAKPPQRYLLIRHLLAVNRCSEAEMVYQMGTRHAGRSAITDCAYVKLLLRRGDYQSAETLVDEAFGYSFRRLPDGQMAGANGERIVYTDTRYVQMYSSKSGKRVDNAANSTASANETPGTVETLECWPFANMTVALIHEQRKRKDHQGALAVYQRFQQVGFENISVYEAILWSMLEADDIAGIVAVMRDLERRGTPLNVVMAQVLVEAFLRRNDLP
ncbi:hypothetical protein THASP1DRAFT_32757, partial [Thamnocephalis sphaerospora]